MSATPAAAESTRSRVPTLVPEPRYPLPTVVAESCEYVAVMSFLRLQLCGEAVPVLRVRRLLLPVHLAVALILLFPFPARIGEVELLRLIASGQRAGEP